MQSICSFFLCQLSLLFSLTLLMFFGSLLVVYLLTCLSATLYRAPRPWEDPSTLTSLDAVPARLPADTSGTKPVQFGPDETERNQIKDRHEERKPASREKEERHEKGNKHERREKRRGMMKSDTLVI